MSHLSTALPIYGRTITTSSPVSLLQPPSTIVPNRLSLSEIPSSASLLSMPSSTLISQGPGLNLTPTPISIVPPGVPESVGKKMVGSPIKLSSTQFSPSPISPISLSAPSLLNIQQTSGLVNPVVNTPVNRGIPGAVLSFSMSNLPQTTTMTQAVFSNMPAATIQTNDREQVLNQLRENFGEEISRTLGGLKLTNGNFLVRNQDFYTQFQFLYRQLSGEIGRSNQSDKIIIDWLINWFTTGYLTIGTGTYQFSDGTKTSNIRIPLTNYSRGPLKQVSIFSIEKEQLTQEPVGWVNSEDPFIYAPLLGLEKLQNSYIIGTEAYRKSSDLIGGPPCPRCQSTRTHSEARQTASADESVTVFNICDNCGMVWKSQR